MKMFRNSIGAKLITIVVGVVLLSISVTTATSLHREVSNFNGSFTAELLGTAQILASSVASPLANNDKSAVQGTLTAIARLIIFYWCGSKRLIWMWSLKWARR